MMHKIKIGNRVINLSDPQKKLLDEMDDDTFILKYGSILEKCKEIDAYMSITLPRKKTVNSLIRLGLLIVQSFSENKLKIIKSF